MDGQSLSLDEPPKLTHRRKHKIEVVVDRAIVRRAMRSRLSDSIEAVLDLGKGVLHIAKVGAESTEPRWPVDRYSQHRVCDRCSRSFDELAPHHFSFNSPLGWCGVCQGLGIQQGANPAELIPDGRKSLRQGAVVVWPSLARTPLFARMIEALGAAEGIALDVPFDDLDSRSRRIILHGAGDRWYSVALGQEVPPSTSDTAPEQDSVKRKKASRARNTADPASGEPGRVSAGSPASGEPGRVSAGLQGEPRQRRESCIRRAGSRQRRESCIRRAGSRQRRESCIRRAGSRQRRESCCTVAAEARQ